MIAIAPITDIKIMIIRIAIILISLLHIYSCATTKLHEDNRVKPEDSVIIKGMSNFDLFAGGHASKVCEFNGMKLSPCKPSIEFLPGRHTLIIKDNYLGIPGKPVKITKHFDAGDRYLLGVRVVKHGVTEAALIYQGNINDESKNAANFNTPNDSNDDSEGHETIPYPAPKDCIWIRGSKSQKYELEC